MAGLSNVEAQRTARITAELVAMASDILRDPDSSLRRSALAHAVRAVIRAEGDAPLLQAIELAPDLHVARVIRAAAEAACDVISVVDNGIGRHTGLFSVAFVVRFADAIATQEFEDALSLASWSEPFLARLHDCGARHSISYILPHVFLFEDLAILSFGSVHRSAMMASATNAQRNAGTIMPFPVTAPAQRRSATFLRYLVGYQLKGDRALDRTAAERSQFCDCVRSVMHASIPEAQHVIAIYTEHFYEPIWQGLQIYHTHRLAEVVRIVARRGAKQSKVSASITVVGSRNQMEAQLRFLCRGETSRRHAYRIPLRPLDDPSVSADRIAAELSALGVGLVAGVPGREKPGRYERHMSARRSANGKATAIELILPL